MNSLEKQMIKILVDLRINHGVAGLKLSFEDEGTLPDEAATFMRIAQNAMLPVSIKVGGCDARRGIYEAWCLCATRIVAPMVETPYALKLYINALNTVCPEWQESGIKAFINIETITGCNNLEEILSIPEAAQLSGCVMGRVDLVGSMNLPREAVNDEQVFNVVYAMAQKLKKANKDLLLGGSISIDAMSFIERLPDGVLKYFETRNVIFDVSAKDSDIRTGLIKAMKFELDWLRCKQEKYSMLAKRDEQRIQMMTVRYEESCKKNK